MRTPWSVVKSLDFIHPESSYAVPASVGTGLTKHRKTQRRNCRQNDTRSERFPEYFSRVSKPICALREVLAKRQGIRFAGDIRFESAVPDHRILRPFEL